MNEKYCTNNLMYLWELKLKGQDLIGEVFINLLPFVKS